MNAHLPPSIATAQQVYTLLYYLQHKQQPPFAMVFWSALQQIEFDYTPASIQRLEQLVRQLKQQAIDVEKMLQQPGGANFLLAVAAYLGDYVAQSTGEQATWYDFDALLGVVEQQNQQHGTQLPLSPVFGNALTVKIGGVYGQPLVVLQAVLAGQLADGQLTGDKLADSNPLATFISNLQQAVFANTQVNLLDDANHVAYQYLSKVKTGRLRDTSIGYQGYFAAIVFDFSQASLGMIDGVLTQLAQTLSLESTDYATFVAQPANQALLYFLGFYIGVTSGMLAKVPSKWVSYEDLVAMLPELGLRQSIEHSFVQLMQEHYRTPMLVVTNRLFAIAPHFPTTAVAFAQLVAQQNQAELQVFSPTTPFDAQAITQLPLSWQQAMQAASGLVIEQLHQLQHHQPLVPLLQQVFSPATPPLKTAAEPVLRLANLDPDSALDKLYRQLADYQSGGGYQVASFGLDVNLPMGQCEGIALEIRVTEPNLALQLILPYRQTSDSEQINEQEQDLVIYPLITNQTNISDQLNPQMQTLVGLIYHQLQHSPMASFWQAHAVASLDKYAISPMQQQQILACQQLVADIRLPVLPVSSVSDMPLAAESALGIGLKFKLAPFDYTRLTWRGYDLPKYIVETPDNQREYLQVVAPDALINDPLFTQAEAMERLYRYGKVVWAVVVEAAVALSQRESNDEAQRPPAEALTKPVWVAEVLYDVTGQASVVALQQAAHDLNQLTKANIPAVSPEQAFYVAHRQEATSRVFGLSYPQEGGQATLSQDTANYRISSTWVWRQHLPNGLLFQGAVVPIIIEPSLSNTMNQQIGRVMVLPSRFWRPDFYQYWLANSRQRLGLTQDHDLMPMLIWQEQQGFRYHDTGNKMLETRLFPKFKLAAKAPVPPLKSPPPSPHPIPTRASQATASTADFAADFSHALPQATAPVTINPKTINSETVNLGAMNPVSINKAEVTQPAQIRPEPPGVAPQKVTISSELQQQLQQNQARLQAELSTKDAAKEKKLSLIIAGVVVLIIITWVVGNLKT